MGSMVVVGAARVVVEGLLGGPGRSQAWRASRAEEKELRIRRTK